MTLHKVGEPPIRGLYVAEIQSFLDSRYDSAWSDLYDQKTVTTRIVGFRNAIKKLGAPVDVSHEAGKIRLDRKKKR